VDEIEMIAGKLVMRSNAVWMICKLGAPGFLLARPDRMIARKMAECGETIAAGLPTSSTTDWILAYSVLV
jgi:hypothetical protein